MKINATYDQWTYRIPGTTVYITPPRPIFQARYLHSWNSTCSGARKVGAGTSRRELSEDVSFGIDTLFRCRAVELGKSPKGGVIYTVIYGHAPRKNMPSSGSTGRPTPAAAPRDVPHIKTAWSSQARGKWGALCRGQESPDGWICCIYYFEVYCCSQRRSSGHPFQRFPRPKLLLDITHTDLQVQGHLWGDSADLDGSSAAISKACKRQY